MQCSILILQVSSTTIQWPCIILGYTGRLVIQQYSVPIEHWSCTTVQPCNTIWAHNNYTLFWPMCRNSLWGSGNSMCSYCWVVKNPENPGFLTNGGYLPLYICIGEKQVFYLYCSTCYWKCSYNLIFHSVQNLQSFKVRFPPKSSSTATIVPLCKRSTLATLTMW